MPLMAEATSYNIITAPTTVRSTKVCLSDWSPLISIVSFVLFFCTLLELWRREAPLRFIPMMPLKISLRFHQKMFFFFLLFSSLRRWTPHFQLVAENLNVNHFCNIHSTCMKYYTRRTESLQFYGGSKIPISFYCLRAPILHAWKDWPLIIFRAYMHNAQPWTKSTLVLALFRSNFFSCTYFESISSSTFKNWL